MNRKFLIVALVLLQSHSILPSWQSAWYVTGVGFAFMASKTEQPKKMALCSTLATIIFIGMIRDSYWKYDRFATASAKINEKYEALTTALSSGNNATEFIKSFRGSIMRNNPENINKFWNSFIARDIQKTEYEDYVDDLGFIKQFGKSHYKCQNNSLKYISPGSENYEYAYEYCNFESEKNAAQTALESEAQTCKDNLVYTVTSVAIPLCLIGYSSMKNGASW